MRLKTLRQLKEMTHDQLQAYYSQLQSYRSADEWPLAKQRSLRDHEDEVYALICDSFSRFNWGVR